MRCIICLFLAVFLASAPALGQERTLRLAGFPLGPYMMPDRDSGKASGAAIRYWQEYLGPKLGYRIEVVGLFPINRVEALLKNGEIDVAPLFTKIPSREAQFQFPRTYYAEAVSCLSVLAESPIKEVRRPEDLAGKRLGFIEGGFVPPFFQHPSILIEKVAAGDDYRQVQLNRLLAGRVDALLEINLASYEYYLKESGNRGRVRIIMTPSEQPKLFSIFRKTEEGARLAEEYDRANAEGTGQGAFEAILRGYLE